MGGILDQSPRHLCQIGYYHSLPRPVKLAVNTLLEVVDERSSLIS